MLPDFQRLEKQVRNLSNVWKKWYKDFQGLEFRRAQRVRMKKIYLTNITLATKVTILRIVGLPVFILLLFYYTLSIARGEPKDYHREIAMALFLLFALTDALDGFLARTRNEITRLGSILDPIADKLLLLSGVILLTRPGIPELQPQFPIAFTLLVISREVILFAGAYVVNHMTGHVDIRPRWTGKVTTVFQMVAVAWALGQGRVDVFMWVVWVAAAFTLVSGIQYLLDGINQFEQEH